MIFCVHVGSEAESSSWTELVSRFAGWVGLALRVEHRSMVDGRKVFLACLEHSAAASSNTTLHIGGGLVFVRSRPAPRLGQAEEADLWRQMEQPPSRNEVRVAVKLDSGELRASVPMATPEQLFYSEDARGFSLTNDTRLAARWADGRVRPAAVFALFQYGMIPAPLSVSDKVLRLLPGHVMKVRPGRGPVTLEALGGPADDSKRESAGTDSEALLLEALDTQLAQAPESSVLYFSGGVDSSLLAARLKRIGRSDVGLINCAFGPEDDEGRLALELASHLGLRCEQVMFDPGEVASLLTRVGRDYSYPFGDDSTIPTNLLVHASIKAFRPGQTILEGTGADGGFGPVVHRPGLWYWLSAAPAPVRRFLGAGYKWFRLWERDPGVPKARMLASLARQSTRMQGEVAAVLSSNALDGVAYSMPRDVLNELAEAIGRPLRLWGDHLSRGERFALLDLIYVCAGRFAAKSFAPLRQAGMDPVYPFLEPDLLRVSFRLPWEEKARGDGGKILLKRLLARDVPRHWVYRQKRAFDAPLYSVLARSEVQEFFHGVVLSSRNPVLDFLQVRVIKKLIDRCRESKPLEMSVYRFLWTILFASAWLGEIDSSLTGKGETSSCKRR